MTRGDIKALAESLSLVSTDGNPGCCYRMKRRVCEAVASALAEREPYFDKVRFVQDAMDEGEPEGEEGEEALRSRFVQPLKTETQQ